MKIRAVVFIIIGILLAGFPDSESLEKQIPLAIQTAVDNPDRPGEDQLRDKGRKPDQILTFFGIKPGMTVLDVFSGGGYYSEILSHLVGPEGRVIAHNDWLGYYFYKDRLPQRYQGRGLENVIPVVSSLADLSWKENSVDAAIMVLSFHDMYWSPETIRPEKVNILAALTKLKKILKPGAVIGIVDHFAPEGLTPEDSVEEGHRIDPVWVKSLMQEAGFDFEGESDILRNPEDDRKTSIFSPEIRGKTDRFVLRFRKPK